MHAPSLHPAASPPGHPPTVARYAPDYLDDPDTVLEKAGVHSGENCEVLHLGAGSVSVGGKTQAAQSMPEVTCLICYDDTAKEYSSLACGHKYCNECYTTFLTHKIKDEGHSAIFATCPHDKVCRHQLIVPGRGTGSSRQAGRRLGARSGTRSGARSGARPGAWSGALVGTGG